MGERYSTYYVVVPGRYLPATLAIALETAPQFLLRDPLLLVPSRGHSQAAGAGAVTESGVLSWSLENVQYRYGIWKSGQPKKKRGTKQAYS